MALQISGLSRFGGIRSRRDFNLTEIPFGNLIGPVIAKRFIDLHARNKRNISPKVKATFGVDREAQQKFKPKVVRRKGSERFGGGGGGGGGGKLLGPSPGKKFGAAGRPGGGGGFMDELGLGIPSATGANNPANQSFIRGAGTLSSSFIRGGGETGDLYDSWSNEVFNYLSE